MNTSRHPRARTGLLVALLFVCVAATLVFWPAAFGSVDHMLFFDDDVSDSLIGWVIAIPLIALALVAVVLALFLTLLLLALVVAIGIFAVLVALAPIVALFAIPALAVVGLVKLLQLRRDAAFAA